MADILQASKISGVESSHVTPEPQRRRPAPKRAPRQLPSGDEIQAWSKPTQPLEDLDSVARRYPRRRVSISGERRPMEVYDTPERPKAFSMDSLEFFFLIAQYFREALPLRLILLLIACQRAGGRIRLTQEEMATVLDVPRAKVNEALREIMGHGIVFKVRRGVYQFNPPYSYRVAEFIPGTELVEAEYVQVDQDKTIAQIRADESLPDLVRFPSLEKMREAIEELRKKRSEERAARRLARALRQEEGLAQ
ncbi:hypothetical protein [Streptomyces sp. NBC_01789]|uniref:hypothetical protein n=1 Tax=Streptomyces sp. NBC_01789 TaxID=2975941 RepID=UPI002252DEA2|nr:hypothetical protein [Streptomyces sp. NBC_01789]MCX4451738.1 hypothetical protein [Streptomyces sp. NBC_01789]